MRMWGRLVDRFTPVALGLAVLACSFIAPGRPASLFDQPPLDEEFGSGVFVVAGVLGVLCGVGALLARRWRWPLYVAAVPAWLTFGMVPGMLAASYYAAVNRRRLPLAAFAGVVLAAYVAGAVSVRGFGWQHVFWAAVAVALLVGLPGAVGLWVRARREVLAGARERAAQLEREQHARTEQARAQERARITREMHDVVAHRVSLMVLHAGALEVNAPDEATAAAAAVIRTTGREALEDLRAALGILRSDDARTEPQPTLADLDRLLEQSRAAGITLDRHDVGDPRDLPATVERTAYRVVQEALTNVHKHAGDASTAVEVRFLPDALEVAVRNGPSRTPAAALPGSGLGLAGLRERVELLGGSFEAGRRLDGGFAVSARLPVAGPA
jgi:signal transduction histidine kinase